MTKFEEPEQQQGANMADGSGGPNVAKEGSAPRIIPSQELFHGDRTAIIEHAGEQYRLILTKNDKLLLQK